MDIQVEKLARIFKALGDPNRLGIVQFIGKESRSVTEIINAMELPQTLVSFHLRTLREAGIVTTRRNGPFINYSLSDPAIMDILVNFEEIGSSQEESQEITEQDSKKVKRMR